MRDKDKTKEQFLEEIKKLRSRIVELEESEEALQESKEELNTIFESARDGIVYLDKTGKIIRVNKYILDVGGYSKEEFVGKRFQVLKVFSPKSIIKMILIFNKIKKGHDVPPYEIELRVKTGEKKIVEICNSILRDKDGVKGIIVIMTDITERRRAEDELKSSEERLKIMFEYAPDAYYLSDTRGTFIDGNIAAEKVMGYKREELIGKNFLELKLLPPKMIPKAAKLLTRNIRGKTTGPDEFILNRKDGMQVPVEISTYPVKIEDKIVVLGIARDITKRKKAEEKIKASLKEKEVLLQEIHHRVKNNMQIISSLLRLQSAKAEDKKTKEIFRECQNRIRTMSLIHEKLYQSKDFAKINFAQYIDGLAVHTYHSYGVDSNIIALKTDLEEVFLDLNRAIPCALIANELLSNSVKHAFPQGKKGEICIKLRSGKKGMVTLIVSDNGIGFPEDIDFRKASSLGLQMVNDLTSQINGTFELDRTGGTAFKVKFSVNE